MVCDAICSIPTKRFDRVPKNPGGLIRLYIKNSQNSLTNPETKALEKEIERFYEESLQPKNIKHEEAIENAFHIWLKEQSKFENITPKDSIINFRSFKRSGAIWENVDGYAISIEESRFHISFKPILTTFEVKAKLPDKRDIRQAKEYLIFSHYVFLVFKYDGSEEELNEDLLKESVKFESHEGIGIYFTNDGKSFKCYEKSKPNTRPLETEVDKHINRLLLDQEKDILLKLRHTYILKNLTPPQTN
jgi:hypothetical protein